MQTAKGWEKELKALSPLQLPSPPSYYRRMLRDFRDCGFRLATAEMANLYFALVLGAKPNALPEDRYYESPWLEHLADIAYGQHLTEMTEVSPGWFAYATHARSEDLFEAIQKCLEYFADQLPEVWIMPVTDDEEMVGLTFEFLVGSEAEVSARLRSAEVPQSD